MSGERGCRGNAEKAPGYSRSCGKNRGRRTSLSRERPRARESKRKVSPAVQKFLPRKPGKEAKKKEDPKTHHLRVRGQQKKPRSGNYLGLRLVPLSIKEYDGRAIFLSLLQREGQKERNTFKKNWRQRSRGPSRRRGRRPLLRRGL